MKTIQILITALILTVTAISAKAEGPLIVTTSPEWTVKYNGEKGIQFYTVKKPGNKDLVLMFSVWPPSRDPKEIPKLIDQMAKGFAEQAKNNPELKTVDLNYSIEPIQGDTFSGSMFRFKYPGGVQIGFMISNGDGIWNGQYTGPEAEWKDALKPPPPQKTKGKKSGAANTPPRCLLCNPPVLLGPQPRGLLPPPPRLRCPGLHSRAVSGRM
jgi:hypothetical protein